MPSQEENCSRYKFERSLRVGQPVQPKYKEKREGKEPAIAL